MILSQTIQRNSVFFGDMGDTMIEYVGTLRMISFHYHLTGGDVNSRPEAVQLLLRALELAKASVPWLKLVEVSQDVEKPGEFWPS